MIAISLYAMPSIRQSGVEFLIGKNMAKSRANDVITAVCNHFGVTFKQINVKSRKMELLVPRQMIMYILAIENSLSLAEIGRLFKEEYDHTTVIHSRETMRDLIQTGLHFEDHLKIMISLNS